MKKYDVAVIGGGFAGVAAAMAAAGAAVGIAVANRCEIRDIDVKELQRVLKDNGAFIGI